MDKKLVGIAVRWYGVRAVYADEVDALFSAAFWCTMMMRTYHIGRFWAVRLACVREVVVVTGFS
jgi:hypothetical protein